MKKLSKHKQKTQFWVNYCRVNFQQMISPIKLEGGILYIGDKLLVPKNLELANKILLELHLSLISGHVGIKKIVVQVTTNFFLVWDVARY